jgi:hypothetical protein
MQDGLEDDLIRIKDDSKRFLGEISEQLAQALNVKGVK